MAKRGVSAEEKKQRMVDLLYEKREPFTLKELEKLAPKAKDIKFPLVKGILVELESEYLLEKDKIGASVFYWSFPSATSQKRQVRLKKLKEELETKKRKREELENKIAEETVGKEDTEERKEKKQKYSELQEKNIKLKEELQRFKDFDPDIVEQMKNDATTAKEAANRWTDNYFMVRDFAAKKTGVTGAELDKAFEAPPDLDYL